MVGKLLVEETKYNSDLAKNKEEYLNKLENEMENAVKVQKMLKRQMKSQDVTLKEKIRYNEQLERKFMVGVCLKIPLMFSGIPMCHYL